MFLGFIDENTASNLPVQLRNASNAPVEPDAAPTWRVFGQAGQVAGGSGSASSFETGSITGATNASPVVITSTAHGLPVGTVVTVSGVLGNTGANGTYRISVVGSANLFTLAGSVGNAAYTSGGTWKTTGLYKVVLTGAILAALEAGKTYTLVVYWLESGQNRTAEFTFTVR